MLANLLKARDWTAVPQMTAGWLYGITYQEWEVRDKLMTCFKANNDLTDDYYEAMAAYENGDTSTGDSKFDDAEQYYNDAFGDCEKAVTDALSQWGDKLKNMKSRDDYSDVSEQIYNAHKDEIDLNVSLMFKTWDEGVFYNAGMFAGRIDKIMLDNLPQQNDTTQDPQAPAQFIAGWLYGITLNTIEDRDAIIDCYKSNTDLTSDYYDAMADYKAGKTSDGDAKFDDAEQYYSDAFGSCGDSINNDLEAWGQKVKDMKSADNWDTVSQQIYTDNKAKVDADVGYMNNSWDRGVFYDAGLFAGRIDRLFLDNVPSEQIAQILALF